MLEKFVPVIVTLEPTLPLEGENEVIVGTCALEKTPKHIINNDNAKRFLQNDLRAE